MGELLKSLPQINTDSLRNFRTTPWVIALILGNLPSNVIFPTLYAVILYFMAGLWRENLATNILSWIACVSFRHSHSDKASSQSPPYATGYPLTTIELELCSPRRFDQSLLRPSIFARKRFFDPLRPLLGLPHHQPWCVDLVD